jgi:dephospho-CoA kinase
VKIIGISGTNGSGKDTLAQILVEDYDWVFVSGSDILRQELRRRNMPIERKHLRELSAEWRRKYHHGHLIDEAVKEFKKSSSHSKGLVVSSLRNPGEAERIHELGGTVVWLDADPKLRYQRIYSRQRSREDQKSFEQFLAEEQAEMRHHNGDKATLNMAGVKAQADIFITNDSNDFADFKKASQKALASIL